MRRKWYAVMRVVLTGVLLVASPCSLAAQDLHVIWNGLLASHVQDGKVDYQGFKKDERQLGAYLALLDTTDPGRLADSERLPFYINAYNAYTVQLILDNFRDGRPVQSIKDIGGFFSSPWSIEIARIGGKALTLDTIEHEIIRPQFRDPRIHFAINCAARSCPPLRNEAYTGRELERQLNDSTAAFLNNPKATYLEDNILYVSKIFDWFGEDFGEDISGFVARYARPELAAGIARAGSSLRVKFLPYDWSLNQAARPAP